MGVKTWTKEEEQYLAKHYGKVKIAEIAERLGKKDKAIYDKAKRMGLQNAKKEYVMGSWDITVKPFRRLRAQKLKRRGKWIFRWKTEQRELRKSV